ncbi:MAG: aldehyde ferredoxin oxidoreductase family protein [Bacillota bacterium]|nr:aldehyde ferredoxin oxidoreductase family protein [Bacillota bacterium]
MIKLRYAVIDLSTQEVNEYPISDKTFELYIGGKALGARILYDELQPGVDPLSAENIIIVNTSPLNGTGAPSSSRFNMTTKNVLTGGIASSNCGGQFGVKMRKAGYDGLIIKGRAQEPSYIEIMDGEIQIKNASHLWGMDTEKTQQQFDRRYGKLVIGPAGENLVKYACAVSGERVLGRCGVGAVMGAKNLKALVAYGTMEIPVYNRHKLQKFVQRWVKYLKHHKATGEAMPLYGSAGFVNQCNTSGILPTRDFQKGTYEKADAISGETLSEQYMTRNSGCVSCPIRCERRVMVNGNEVKGPEFETIGLFGSNIDCADLELINQWNYQADLLGMDTISLAGTLAFVMELAEKGIKDFGLHFGEVDKISEVIKKIAYREGEYTELGEGTKCLADIYGGEDFAIHSKGLELASYEPRKAAGQGLGYATANRGGCHLNAGYLAFLEAISPLEIDPITTKGKAGLVALFQNGTEAISSAGFCLFMAFALIPNAVYNAKPSSKMVGLLGKSLIGSHIILDRLGSLLPGAIPFNSLYLFPQAEAIRLATGLKMTSWLSKEKAKECRRIFIDAGIDIQQGEEWGCVRNRSFGTAPLFSRINSDVCLCRNGYSQGSGGANFMISLWSVKTSSAVSLPMFQVREYRLHCL